jgi:hypothetical protein
MKAQPWGEPTWISDLLSTDQPGVLFDLLDDV